MTWFSDKNLATHRLPLRAPIILVNRTVFKRKLSHGGDLQPPATSRDAFARIPKFLNGAKQRYVR